MVQVVTSENMGQFLETGRVDEYKAPDPVPPVESNSADKQPEPKVEAKAEEKSEEKPKEAAEAADDGLTDEHKDLSEKVRRQIGAKHRAMKEAQEARADAEAFAETTYRERLLAEKRAEAAEERLKALESAKASPTEVADPAEPKHDDRKADGTPKYADAIEFARDLAKYEAEKAVKADRQEREKAENQRKAAEADATRIARNKAFAKDHPDYVEVVDSLKDNDLMVPAHIAEYLMESEQSPALMYHFAKNRDEFERIAQLSPIRAIAAIGKLEASLESKPEPKAETHATPKSKAPAPIATLSDSQVTVEKDLSKMTTRETIEYWEARNRASATRRKRH